MKVKPSGPEDESLERLLRERIGNLNENLEAMGIPGIPQTSIPQHVGIKEPIILARIALTHTENEVSINLEEVSAAMPDSAPFLSLSDKGHWVLGDTSGLFAIQLPAAGTPMFQRAALLCEFWNTLNWNEKDAAVLLTWTSCGEKGGMNALAAADEILSGRHGIEHKVARQLVRWSLGKEYRSAEAEE